MSKCRCGEIVNIRLQLFQVNDAISQLNNCQQSFSNISTDLNSLSTYSEQAYSSNKISQVSTALKVLDDDLISAKEVFYNKLITKNEELSNELSDLEGEDEAYHEEERKRMEAANETPTQ